MLNTRIENNFKIALFILRVGLGKCANSKRKIGGPIVNVRNMAIVLHFFAINLLNVGREKKIALFILRVGLGKCANSKNKIGGPIVDVRNVALVLRYPFILSLLLDFRKN